MQGSQAHEEASIARCRLILSLTALLAVFIDPTEPLVARWFPLTSGHFVIDPYVLVLMAAHLTYSVAVMLAVGYDRVAAQTVARATTMADVVFGAAIAFMTEGVTSPFYPFFAFAVVVAGLRAGLRQALVVTCVSVSLYLGMIVVSAPGNMNLYIMRPVYLAIAGYLVGYLGEQRIALQREMRRLEAAEQRHRIARDLHDGCVQALAGINLRLEGCRRSLQAGDTEDVATDLLELRQSVEREYGELRSFMCDLAGVAPSLRRTELPHVTRLSLAADLTGPIDLVDHVLQIAREGLVNIRRHAHATSARIIIRMQPLGTQIQIVDDGVGLAGDRAPWSIASRVNELGGEIFVQRAPTGGTELAIRLPKA